MTKLPLITSLLALGTLMTTVWAVPYFTRPWTEPQTQNETKTSGSLPKQKAAKPSLSQWAASSPPPPLSPPPPITGPTDTFPLRPDRQGDFITDQPRPRAFDLKDPKAIEKTVEYDIKTGYYIIRETIAGRMYRPPMYMTLEEYLKWREKNEDARYFQQLSQMNTRKAGDDPIKPYKERIQSSLVDRLFCGSNIDVRPQGNIDITFGGDYQKVQNPILTLRQQRQGGFDFDMGIALNLIGKIGQKLQLSFNYNNQAQFSFDQQVKIQYLTETPCSEDDIIRKIDAGNVSFPLRSSLIQGRQNLFGFRTDLQFGRLTWSMVASQSQTRRKELQIQGGAQLQKFEVTADRYDENRHFFLAHYHRNTYEQALTNLPQINSLVNITKLEVWITNDRNVTEGVRDVVAFTDIGEPDDSTLRQPTLLQGATQRPRDLFARALPHNESNVLFNRLLNSRPARQLQNSVSELQNGFGMEDGTDFVKFRARKLAPSEYSFHPQLGFVSLNVSVKPTDVIAIAYQYSYNGQVYQVGEFAQDVPLSSDTLTVMYLKMLKSVRHRIDLPLWDLMMKNVYSLNAFQVNEEGFTLDVFYQEPGGGEKRFIPEGPVASEPLLRLLNLDNLNRVRDPMPDGQFDFVPGLTILPQNGRVIFPVLEPFGRSLERHFIEPSGRLNPLARKYVYYMLYDSTVTRAREYPELNRYIIRGEYKSSISSEISLGGFNIPRGSVVVTAGGATLTEGTDYTIDYNLGRIKITNEAYLNSGQPIRVTFEDNSTFGFNRQGFFGSRFDYYINDKFNIGATFLHLVERPFTQKVNYGDDPISNSIYGFDVQYSEKAPWLTRLLDKLPFYSTKAPSNIAFTGEFAHLLPGTARVISQGEDAKAGGVVFIDDFEGAANNFNLSIPSLNWVLSSTPRGEDNPLFPEASLINDLNYGKNRAKLAWYRLDPELVLRRPAGISDTDLRSIYVRQINITDVFRNRQLLANQTAWLQTFDMAYFPRERGPYNFSLDNVDPNTGLFSNPKQRWGGIMRSLQNNDFEANNIEFIEIWMMSPFKEGKGGEGGDLYIDLGDVSEDILKDSRLYFENGMPPPNSGQETDLTVWSRIPRVQAITNAFDNDPAIRETQDIGLDGFDDVGERTHFQQYLDDLAALVGTNSPVYQAALADPSGDNFRFFRDEFYDNVPPPPGTNAIVNRYKAFNNPEGNSSGDPNQNLQQVTTSTNLPDTEDINRDNTLNEQEAYFQYHIPLRRVPGTDLMDFTQYTTDSIAQNYDGPNGPETVFWYQLKIPIDQFTSKVGGIDDFRGIRFMRMYLTGFEEETILRFARLDLIRNQWRRYIRPLIEPGAYLPGDNEGQTAFDVNAVNIEENGQRSPFPYVLPPGVQREQAIGTLGNALQNEQSMAVTLCNLQDGDARAIYKNINMDMRVYERIKMFVHAEDLPQTPITNSPGDLRLFMRIGSDYEQNYYEYEIPLTMSTNIGSGDPLDIWLRDNEVDFPLELLRNLKISRNLLGFSLSQIYTESDPDKPNNRVRIIGNPDLNFVKGIMIGVRNPQDDGLPRCVYLWVNELRLTGFDNRGGTAGLGRLDVQLADLGQVTLSGSYKSIGFGQIEQRVNERQRENFVQYDVSGTLNLEKFFPAKWKLRLPFFAQYAQELSTPEYDPYQLDIRLKDQLRAALSREARDSIRQQAQTVRTISSFNFTNVRKEKTSKRAALPFDISNFGFTYAQSKIFFRTPIIESEERAEYRAVIDYTYTVPIKPIEPFKKLFKKPNKWFALITDFNFMPLPNTLGFRNEMIRRFSESRYRFSDANNSTWYDKRFTWDRAYNLQWNLTRSLNLNFTATNNSIIDEPFGRLDTKEKRDTVLDLLRDLGRNKAYTHSLNASYNLPLNKIPILDWVSVRTQYSTNYSWSVASLNVDSLGNVIGNSQNRQLNADFQFDKLYLKSKYLKKINTPQTPNKGPKPPDKGPKERDPNEKEKPQGDKKEKDKNKEREPSAAERALLRPLMLLRRGRLTYNEALTTSLPGFMPMHRVLGSNGNFSAPGLDFLFGLQPDQAWLDRAASNGLISDNIFMNQQFTQTRQMTYSAKLTLEPFQSFLIDVDLDKTLSENYAENFKVDTIGGSFKHLNPMRMGSSTISFMPIRTMRDRQGQNGFNSSATFEQFEANRVIISQRIGQGSHQDQTDNPNFTDGYGRLQQDVLIPAFLAAYTGQEASKIPLQDIRNLIPKPNWKLTYNGLSKLKPFAKWFSSFTLTHGYRSTLSINRYATNINHSVDPEQLDPRSLNYYSAFEIPDIVISEQFNPLIGIDLRLKNELTFRFNYKSSRNLAMSFLDYQLSQTTSEDITVGFGMLIKNFKPFARKDGKSSTSGFNFDFGGKIIPKHELNLKFDFSLRDDKTINHILDQRNSVATRGMRTIRIAPSADYIINNKLTLRLFFDYNRTIPAVQTSFPITATRFGVTLRFMLAQ